MRALKVILLIVGLLIVLGVVSTLKSGQGFSAQGQAHVTATNTAALATSEGRLGAASATSSADVGNALATLQATAKGTPTP